MEATYDHFPFLNTNTADVAATGPKSAEYLARLARRRDGALAAGDAALVADCEDRIVRHELFLVELTRWGERRRTS